MANRIDGLTKSVGDRVLATSAVAQASPKLFASRGSYDVRGLSHKVEIFGLLEPARTTQSD